MQRANDNPNQPLDELKRTVATTALRVNQLERLLDGKELNEAKVDAGAIYHRTAKMSLSNGLTKGAWAEEVLAEDGVTSLVAGTGVTIDPVTGLGDVTVNNSGVTKIVAGTNVTIDPVTGLGDVTINGSARILPSNASKSQYMVLQLSDNVGGADDPTKWTVDWVRWA